MLFLSEFFLIGVVALAYKLLLIIGKNDFAHSTTTTIDSFEKNKLLKQLTNSFFDKDIFKQKNDEIIIIKR